MYGMTFQSMWRFGAGSASDFLLSIERLDIGQVVKRCNLFCKCKLYSPLDVEGSTGVDGQGQQGEDHAEDLNVRDPPC